MKKDNILLSSAFYSVGNMIGAGLNLIYQFVLMIFISLEDYGIVQPLLQFVGLLLLPVAAYQFALTKHFSDMNNEELQNESRFILNQLIKYSFYISIVWVLFIPIFKYIFHIDDVFIFILLLISLLLNTIQIPYLCRLQSEKKFFIAGIAQIIQGAVRVSLGLLCVWISPTIWGAMIGVIISNITFVIGNIFEYKNELLKKNPEKFIPKKIPIKLLFISLGSVGMFSLLTYSDTVLVRPLLPNESALFASSNLLGKGMLFLSAGISFVLLPILAGKLGDSKKSLWIGFGCLLILVLSYVLFFYLTAPILEYILFKNEMSIVGEFQYFMPYYNLMFIPYPLIYYFLNYYLVKENPFYPSLLFCGVILLYAGIFINHSSIYAISNIVGGVGYLLLFIVMLHSIFSKDIGSIHEEYINEKNIENLV